MLQPEAELIATTIGVSGASPLQLIEYAGRVDYGDKSLARMGEPGIIGRWITSGHESMVEMADATFVITCSRVVSHELVRHRIASFQQESQRYVRYDDEQAEDLFVLPPELSKTEAMIVEASYENALAQYKKLKSLGVKSQIARYVLPNGTRTRIVMKANLREWRHFCRLRTHSSAQPEMRLIATQIFETLHTLYPEVFADVQEGIEAGRRSSR